jgi:GAF domain-containing protein
MTYDPDSGLHLPPADTQAEQRVALLRELGLDHPDQEFDAFAAALAADAGVPYAMVNVHLSDQQFFVGLHSPQGGDLPEVGRSMPRDHGYCPDVVTRQPPLVLPNVMAHSRFAGNPVVDLIGIQTYAGARLFHEPTGTVLGTVCFVGTDPLPQETGQASLRLIQDRRDALMNMIYRRTGR